MEPEDWEVYIDTGFVKIEDLKNIAMRIKYGAPLDLQDLQVYQTHAQIIETFLRQ